MYTNVSRTEIKYIKQMAGRGMEAKAIATQLKINLPRVETFMPKDPEVEKKEAKERADARAKTRAAEEAKPNRMELNKAKKRRAKADAAKAA